MIVRGLFTYMGGDTLPAATLELIQTYPRQLWPRLLQLAEAALLDDYLLEVLGEHARN